MKRLLVLGANPAWQKVLFFDKFNSQEINRSIKKLEFASGKGINFARASICHGVATPLLLQFTAGNNGRSIEDVLLDERIPYVSYSASGETRCCCSCIDQSTHKVTEIIEPSAVVDTGEVLRLQERWEQELSSCDMAAICGTMPQGLDGDFYIKCIEMAKSCSKPILLDTFKYAEQIFAIGGEVTLKINSDELAQLTGKKDVICGIRELFRAFPLKHIAITAGERDAYMSDGSELFVYKMPRISGIVNTIGCGDCASAVLAGELANGRDIAESFKIALGAAMANTLNPFCGNFSCEDTQKYRNLIEITQQTL